MSKKEHPPQQLQTVQKVELEKPVGGQASVEQLFAQYQKSFRVVAAAGLDLNRMMRVATMVMSRSQALQKCSAISLLGSFMTAAQLGLDFGLGECHLVPFKNKYTHQPEVQLIPDYKGLIKLARNSGKILDIWARLVYKGEHFKVREGDDPRLDHEPDYAVDRKPINIIAAYTIATWDDGRKTFEVITRAKIERAHSSSAAGSGPWDTDYDEMAMKTAIKHRCKTLPRSEKLAAAIQLDDRAQLGKPQAIELLQTGDNFMAQLGPEPPDEDQAQGSVVLISGTQQGKLTTWLKQNGWSEPQARQMLKKEIPALDVSLDSMQAVVCQIEDKDFERIIDVIEKGPDGKGAAKKQEKQPKEDPADGNTATAAASDPGDHEISDDQYQDLWALAVDKKAAQAAKEFATKLGYTKLTQVKVKDLAKVTDFINEYKESAK